MKTNPGMPALVVGIALILIGLVTRGRIGTAFGLSGEFWSGCLFGVALVLAIAGVVLILRR